MARPLVISEHALDRFAERHPEAGRLEAGQVRQVFLEELERGVPFGGQRGDDELSLLPCGVVAVIKRSDGVRVVKTVLTKELAIANMQAQGVVPQRFRRRPVRDAADSEPQVEGPVAPDPLLTATMRRPTSISMRASGRRHATPGSGSWGTTPTAPRARCTAPSSVRRGQPSWRPTGSRRSRTAGGSRG
jgi:hypothetical protein